MKLAEHVDQIRLLIDSAFRNRLGRMGFSNNQFSFSEDENPTDEKRRIVSVFEVLEKETADKQKAYEKLVEEFTFTLFNRLAALKVMEAHTLHPEIVTRRSQHGDRSFAHKHWLEQNPHCRSEEMEGLVRFLEDQFEALSADIPLFNLHHPYHLLPTAIELNGIINAFNRVETDPQVEKDIWNSDDVLGWLYESYNNYKKLAHKESGDPTEYDKVSIQSQVYTPRWVVKFLVDNSLGKLYLEMYPDSDIKIRYKIANAPKTQTRKSKPLTEIKLIDPAPGSGNFLLYSFDLFYDLYTDQIENYGANYDDQMIAELIIAYNLHGVDLDDRAIQLAQLGLYIKAKRKKRSAKIEHFNVVSSDFFLPPYEEVQSLFEENAVLDSKQKEIIRNIWTDLQQAYRFGSLVRLEEKLSIQLHGLTQQSQTGQLAMFTTDTLADYDQFRDNFFANLQKAVEQNAAKLGQTFLNTKTQDAIIFLQLLTQKYDVLVANPPYTDSGDFGCELKRFIDTNYKQPYKFNTNLYATFIKRSSELIIKNGFIGMLHPLSFMYISSFKDVRKFILTQTHIEVVAELGLGGVFANSDVQADVVAYILKNITTNENSIFLDFKEYKNHTNKPDVFKNVYENLVNNLSDDHIFQLSQNSFKEVQDWPFIYWISNSLRKKFNEKALDYYAKNSQGMSVSNGEKYQRFHWEVTREMISFNNSADKKKWVPFVKGGPYNKWFGNNWLLVNWNNNGSELKNFPNAAIRNQEYYFLEGITYCSSGSKGSSFRYLPENYLFSGGGPSITLKSEKSLLPYLMGFLNSKLSLYLLNCLNPTVNTTQGDLNRVPFVKPLEHISETINALVTKNIEIKRQLTTYQITELNYLKNPLLSFDSSILTNRLLAYLNFENLNISQVLLNESIINLLIFNIYELSEEDKQQVNVKMGKSIGEFPVLEDARKAFLVEASQDQKFLNDYITKLAIIEDQDVLYQRINPDLALLYKGNNNLEEFCIRHKVNPINVWYWFKESKLLPQVRAAEIALEFLADAFRTILMEDEDGIVPLVGLPGESRLMDRLENYSFQQGFSSAQFMQLDGLLGYPIHDFIEHYFFNRFIDHIKYFKQLPSTPFIWHLSSGEHQGFEVYIIIYKWNRDNLYRLKSSYLSKRTESLQYRLQQIGDSTSAQSQTEKETIRLQLQEIDAFAKKIDELIAEGYDPKLDDGVGKNIAPLQKKGMLRAEVLNKKQMEKYLNADW